MLGYAVTFLLIAILALWFGFGTVAVVAAVVSMITFAISLFGRQPRGWRWR